MTMDRREALKRLAAGGAFVVASPVILPSVRVAHAASPGETDLVGVPAAGEPIPFGTLATAQGKFAKNQVAIVPDMAGVTCADGSAAMISYEWRIVSVTWGKPSKPDFLRVVEATSNTRDPAGTQLAVMPPSKTGFNGPTAYSARSYATGFLIRKGTSKGDVALDATDRYSVEMRVRWECDGATSALEAEYLFAGVQANTPTVTNTSWNIVPA